MKHHLVRRWYIYLRALHLIEVLINSPESLVVVYVYQGYPYYIILLGSERDHVQMDL